MRSRAEACPGECRRREPGRLAGDLHAAAREAAAVCPASAIAIYDHQQ
ncbi:hypothetical protein ACWCQZ_29160 [Streptomyces sp. NPDC002285]